MERRATTLVFESILDAITDDIKREARNHERLLHQRPAQSGTTISGPDGIRLFRGRHCSPTVSAFSRLVSAPRKAGPSPKPSTSPLRPNPTGDTKRTEVDKATMADLTVWIELMKSAKSHQNRNMTNTNTEMLKTLYALRLVERKPGWDAKVRAAAIEALVEYHYGAQRDLQHSRRLLGDCHQEFGGREVRYPVGYQTREGFIKCAVNFPDQLFLDIISQARREGRSSSEMVIELVEGREIRSRRVGHALEVKMSDMGSGANRLS